MTPSLSRLLPADVRRPVIGMVHLPPLPGSPRAALELEEIIRFASRDASRLIAGGVHALILENLGDVPYYPERVPPATIAQMSVVAATLQQEHATPLGINVLRNDACAALAVAAASGACFVRVNILTGARLTDQGVIGGRAHEVMRERQRLGADIAVLADVDVKHSAPIAQTVLQDEINDTIERGLADAIILSGAQTGQPVSIEAVKEARQTAGSAPILAGSGVTAERLPQMLTHFDGFIVGTAFKQRGETRNPVDLAAVQSMMAIYHRLTDVNERVKPSGAAE